MLRESISVFREINEKANVISMNAEIEGARMRRRLPTFSIVAQHIHVQSKTNRELRIRLEKLVDRIEAVVFSALASRYYEMAEDLIDKLDRNLFERNCDCQAWAGFDAVVDCAKTFKDSDSDSIVTMTEEQSLSLERAQQLLLKLIRTYCVYSDVFLVNKNGIVFNAAESTQHIGENWAQEEWYKEAMQGKVFVSDMQLCPAIKKYSVFYSAPITSSEGEVLGVLSTRFNWDFAQEMIDSAGFDEDVRAYISNKNGSILAGPKAQGTMRDSLDWLDAGQATVEGECGYTLESERNGHPIVSGFAKTKGYNAYRGKAWASIVFARLKDVLPGRYFKIVVDQRSVENPLGVKSPEELIESEKTNLELEKTMDEVDQLLKEINQNNKQAKFLAINASIQAGIAGEDGEGFAIIAEEIGSLAKNSLEFVDSVNKAAEKLRKSVRETVNNRLVDASRDCVDKVDRNLFERFCDVQTWTTFDQLFAAIEDNQNNTPACELLAKLHKIYEVYHDIYLLDMEGKVVASAINRALVGQNQSDREWFQQASAGNTYFSNIYQSKSVGAPTVAFAAPLLNSEGRVTGVLTTRFNCNFLNDIIKAVIVDSKTEVFLVDGNGLVISARRPEDIFNKNFVELDAFRKARDLQSGYLSEKTPHAGTCSVGYAGGKGYNSYPGNQWSILTIRPQAEAATAKEPAKKVS